MVSRLILIICFLGLCVMASDYYVATNGNDTTGDGSIGLPFATIQKAIDTATTAAGQFGTKSVIVRGGSYYNVNVLMDRLRGNGVNATIQGYPGETAIIYGGQLLTNWSAAGSNGCYVATLGTFPASVSSSVSELTTWQPRMLLVNGSWAPRSRDPSVGKYRFTNAPASWYNRANLGLAVYTNDFPASTNMELLLDNSWNDNQVAVTNIDTATKTMTWPTIAQDGGLDNDVVSFASLNTPEGVTQDLNWWWNKTNNSIIYRPPIGVDPNTQTIIVPTTSCLFYFQDNSPDFHACTNCLLTNLTMRVTSVDLCYIKDDHGLQNTAAIAFNGVTNVTISGCTFDCIGGVSVGKRLGANGSYLASNIVQNCIIRNCGYAGIGNIGVGSTASNNLIYNVGLISQCAVGIYGFNRGFVYNNTLSNMNGCAIGAVTSANGCTVKDNWIVRSVKQLRDMGAIYFWGSTNGTVDHNYVAEVYGTNDNNCGGVWDGFVHGIYIDAGSEGWTISSNILFNVMKPWHNNNLVAETWINNVGIDTRAAEDSWFFQNGTNKNNSFTRNIWVSQGLLQGRVPVFVIDHNEYFSIDWAVSDWTPNVTYSYTSNAGNPTNSTSSDPLFVKVPATSPQYIEDANFSFQVGSPCPGLGIQPISLEGIGYNGGLQHRPPDIKVTTLRVGNMRMAQ